MKEKKIAMIMKHEKKKKDVEESKIERKRKKERKVTGGSLMLCFLYIDTNQT